MVTVLHKCSLFYFLHNPKHKNYRTKSKEGTENLPNLQANPSLILHISSKISLKWRFSVINNTKTHIHLPSVTSSSKVPLTCEKHHWISPLPAKQIILFQNCTFFFYSTKSWNMHFFFWGNSFILFWHQSSILLLPCIF